MDGRVRVGYAALYKRVARALARQGLTLRTNRSVEFNPDLGRFYTVDARNRIERLPGDLGAIARDLGVLKGYEEYRPEPEDA